MLESDDIIDSAEGLRISLTLEQFNHIRDQEPHMNDFWPVPTRITVTQEVPCPYDLNQVFPVLNFVLEYDQMHLVKDSPALSTLATKIKDHRVTEMCLGMNLFITDGINVYLVPWLTLPKQSYARTYQEPLIQTIWSSLDLNDRPLLGLMSQDEMFEYPSNPKYTFGDLMGETTSVLRIYHMLPASIARLHKYPNLYLLRLISLNRYEQVR